MYNILQTCLSWYWSFGVYIIFVNVLVFLWFRSTVSYLKVRTSLIMVAFAKHSALTRVTLCSTALNPVSQASRSTALNNYFLSPMPISGAANKTQRVSESKLLTGHTVPIAIELLVLYLIHKILLTTFNAPLALWIDQRNVSSGNYQL